MASASQVTTTPASTGDIVESITSWLKERHAESRASMLVLGLSGGIDSAVVCGLCARAVGPDRVVGVIMPSSSNPDDAVSAARVAEAFGVKSLTVDLTTVSDALLSALQDEDAIAGIAVAENGGAASSTPIAGDEVLVVQDDAAVSPVPVDRADQSARQQLATANVRPRLRMTSLYYVANLVNGVVVGTGNKSEAMIGYYTKYGDGGVDLLPIIDLYKHEVRAVARELGVPQSVIDRPPSAGLWQGQTDEDEIGLSYDQLDEALAAIESGDTTHIDPSALERITAMHKVSEHKRQPIPMFRRS
jgi:NAD+ synthase